MKRWFDFRAQARGVEIVIYDEIGAFGIPAKAFLDELKALGPGHRSACATADRAGDQPGCGPRR